MTREEFDAKRWKLGAWQSDAKSRLWFLAGYFIVPDGPAKWRVSVPLGRRSVPPCDTLEQAQAECEREIIKGLLSALEEA